MAVSVKFLAALHHRDEWKASARGDSYGRVIFSRRNCRGPLAKGTLALRISSGPLTPVCVSAMSAHAARSVEGLGVEFRDAAGVTVLTCAGLKVWDADGKPPASRFVAVVAGARLLVEERGARYPLAAAGSVLCI